MLKFITTIFLVCIFFFLNNTSYASGPPSVANIADDISKSVVNISSTKKINNQSLNKFLQVPEGSPFEELFKDLFRNQLDNNFKKRLHRSLKKNHTLGSGFVLDANGIIITNNHVIEGADEINISFKDGTQLKAEIIGKDTKTDIAVLKVNPDKPLHAVKMGDSDLARIGDWVMAIGNPFGFGDTITVGIISAINRDINSGPYDSFIQTDAAINHGNSGGPLFNMEGEVIGINTAIFSPTGGSVGIGFSIPTNLVNRPISQLIEFGETYRGWLGVNVKPLTDESNNLDAASVSGLLIKTIEKDSPAEKSQLKSGDIILKFAGKPVDNVRKFKRIVNSSKVGKKVKIVILRNEREIHLDVVLGRLEDKEKNNTDHSENLDRKTVTALGMIFQEITDDIRAAENINTNVEGVLIKKVNPGSKAKEKGIQNYDIVIEVGQEKVTKPGDVPTIVQKLKDKGRRNALLLISTKKGDLSFVILPIES